MGFVLDLHSYPPGQDVLKLGRDPELVVLDDDFGRGHRPAPYAVEFRKRLREGNPRVKKSVRVDVALLGGKWNDIHDTMRHQASIRSFSLEGREGLPKARLEGQIGPAIARWLVNTVGE